MHIPNLNSALAMRRSWCDFSPVTGTPRALRKSTRSPSLSRSRSLIWGSIQLDISNTIEYSIKFSMEFCSITVGHPVKLNRIFNGVFNVWLNWAPSSPPTTWSNLWICLSLQRVSLSLLSSAFLTLQLHFTTSIFRLGATLKWRLHCRVGEVT